MKKSSFKIISKISFIVFIFVILILGTNKASAASDFYYTKTNNPMAATQAGGIQFFHFTTRDQCNTSRTAAQSSAGQYYTIGQCAEKVDAPSGSGWVYNVEIANAPVLANNPIGFKTEEDCNTNRDGYLKSNNPLTTGAVVGLCTYKQGVTNNGNPNPVGITPEINASANNKTIISS